MTDPINGTAPHLSLGERLRRRLAWSESSHVDDLDRLIEGFKGAREVSLEFEEQHRVTCTEHEDHELAYTFDGESLDRMILVLERAQAELRWWQRQWFGMIVWRCVLLALAGVNLAFVVANVVQFLW